MHLYNVFDTDDEAGFIYRWFLKSRDKILSDNVVFFLHYHVTAALFFIAGLVVTVGMFIMDPIDCISDQSVDDVIDNYCLYHSTYTLTTGASENTRECKTVILALFIIAIIRHTLNRDTEILTFLSFYEVLEPHPGIAAISGNTSEEQKYHHYYLWVAFLLIIQGTSFYIPRGLWKMWGDSKVDNILKEKDEAFSADEHEECKYDKGKLNSDAQLFEDEKYEDYSKQVMSKWDRLSLYIISQTHGLYYWKLLTCEALNLLNAILQLLIMNLFLSLGLSKGHLWYNEDVLQLIHEKSPFGRGDAVEKMFPKISSCTFYIYGPTGSIVNYQAICVLPINAINEKIYVCLYVWLLFLIALSSLALLYRLLLLIPFIRTLVLKIHLRSEELGNFSLKDIRKRLRIGNWQLLLQLTGNSNMDSWELTNVVKYLCIMCQNMDKFNKSV